MRLRILLPLLGLVALLAVACSSSDESSGDDAVPETSAPTVDDDTGDEPVATEPAGDAPDYEIFSSDEGAGCGVFVSVPADAVDDSTDARAMLWAGVVAEDFSTCGFSDVVEAGLITVNGLDEYNQPDWSTVEEHAFFTVTGWDALVAGCYEAVVTDECAASLEASLTE